MKLITLAISSLIISSTSFAFRLQIPSCPSLQGEYNCVSAKDAGIYNIEQPAKDFDGNADIKQTYLKEENVWKYNLPYIKGLKTEEQKFLYNKRADGIEKSMKANVPHSNEEVDSTSITTCNGDQELIDVLTIPLDKIYTVKTKYTLGNDQNSHKKIVYVNQYFDGSEVPKASSVCTQL